MRDGRIVRSGPPDQVFEDNDVVETVLEFRVLELQRRGRLKSSESQGGGGGGGGVDDNREGGTEAAMSNLVEEERKMAGVLDPRVYWTYFSYTGRGVGLFLVVATFIMYGFHSSQDVWMTLWLRDIHNNGHNHSSHGGNDTAAMFTVPSFVIGRSQLYSMTSIPPPLSIAADVGRPFETTNDDLQYYLR